MDGGPIGGGLRAFTQLAAELGDLKRIRDAGSADSLAVRAFRRAWGRLVAGHLPSDVALAVTAETVAAMRLAGLDFATLTAVGVADPTLVLTRGFDQVAGPIGPSLRSALRDQLGRQYEAAPVPGFVDKLVSQPRAGATCPGRPRLVLEPPENHADHCLIVAVLGVILSPVYGADPATVFLAGLAHHLHNAELPDSGFAGEMLLGGELGPVMQRLFDRALASLPARLAEACRTSLATIGDAATPQGRAFHAADVLDRVLQMRHYEDVARFTTSQALDDLNLVHAGPVQAFHQAVLAEAGLP